MLRLQGMGKKKRHNSKKKYTPKHLSNMDETMSFYKRQPGTAMAIKGEICHEGNMYTRQNDTASILQCRRK
jgi:hypothetical protein